MLVLYRLHLHPVYCPMFCWNVARLIYRHYFDMFIWLTELVSLYYPRVRSTRCSISWHYFFVTRMPMSVIFFLVQIGSRIPHLQYAFLKFIIWLALSLELVVTTAWKVSIFEVFPVRIQSKEWKIRTRKTPNTDTFHVVQLLPLALFISFPPCF